MPGPDSSTGGEAAPAGKTGLAVVVMGVSGSGKSTLGQALADALGCPFLEGDSFHDAAAVAKMRAGHPLSDADRWPWLDRLGTGVREALARGGAAVVACSALRRSYRERLAAGAGVPLRLVVLDVDRAELERRMAARPHHYMPPSLLSSQLDTLEPPGADEHALRLDATRPEAELCRAALGWLEGVAA